MMSSFDRNPKFYAELKAMNEEILRVVDANNKKSPYYDYSDTFQDYIKQIDQLRKDYLPGVDVSEEPIGNIAAQNNVNTSALNTSSTSNNTTSATNDNIGANQSLFSSSLASNSTITSTTQFNNTFTKSDNHNTADNDKSEANGDCDDEGEELVPQPVIDLYQEPNFKYKIRCKLYERVIGGSTQAQLLGCGELYIKDLDTPGKLHLIVRKDPDLRTVILNQVITSSTPLKPIPKAVQVFVPGTDGKSMCYIAKVKDEPTGVELYKQLKEVKNI